MTKWFWYFGWSVVWMFLPWTFFFVPLSNRFMEGGAIYGVIRGLILMVGIVLLMVGFRVIYKMLLARAPSRPDHGHFFERASGGAGMSQREAALVAEARQSAYRSRSTVQDGTLDTAAPPAAPPPTASPTPPNAAPEFNRVNIGQEVATGVMKSAGNPLVRKAYAQAMKEVETKTYDRGLWAMALVECNGDERTARIAYMRARAADLSWSNAKAAEAAEPLKSADDNTDR